MSNSEKPPIQQVAAKAAIMNEQGQVLILREAKTGEDNTNIGQWGLPGGRYDAYKDKTFWDTLHREVREETGLTVEPARILDVDGWKPPIKDVPHHIFGIFVLCHLVEGELVVSHEHDDARWISPADRPQYDVVRPDDRIIDSLADQQRGPFPLPRNSSES